MKRKFKVIVNISINIHNINNNLPVQIIEHKKTMTFADGNPGPDLRQAQKGARVKPVNISTYYYNFQPFFCCIMTTSVISGGWPVDW